MADAKISALTASTTPLAGSEVLPIVQSGTTKQVSVANLTAGRAISATQLTLTTGNLIVASGQGVDFSATPGTGTSELFDDYEGGDWTPSLGGTATYGGATYGRYTKIGRVVTVQFRIDVTLLGTGSNTILSGLPFTSSGAGIQTVACSYYANLAVNTVFLAGYVDGGSTSMYFLGKSVLGATVDNNLALFGNGTVLVGTASYIV